MIFAADNLNTMNPVIARALEKLDPKPLQAMAKACEKAGAQYLDLNPGYLSPRQQGRMAFMVDAVQDVSPLQLILDSPNPEVLARGAALCRHAPLLKEIHGRTTDFLVAADGTVMHGLALIYVIRDLPGVQKFKIVQENLQQTRILLVTGPDFRESDLRTIRSGVCQRLGRDVEVIIDRVAEIPAERSGKFRYVVSHVQADSRVSDVGTTRD